MCYTLCSSVKKKHLGVADLSLEIIVVGGFEGTHSVPCSPLCVRAREKVSTRRLKDKGRHAREGGRGSDHASLQDKLTGVIHLISSISRFTARYQTENRKRGMEKMAQRVAKRFGQDSSPDTEVWSWLHKSMRWLWLVGSLKL